MNSSNKAGGFTLSLQAGKNQGRISKSFYTIKERDPVGEGSEEGDQEVCCLKLKINHGKKGLGV